jgi:hypothetical protein
MPPAAITPVSENDEQNIVAKQNSAVKHLTALQAISQGTSLPGIPSFTSYEKHRHWILEHMVQIRGVFLLFC